MDYYDFDNFDRVSRSDWRNGNNVEADEVLHKARIAFHAGDDRGCFVLLRQAMVKYGWVYHSDKKARRLWRRWEEVHAKFLDDFIPAAEIEELFHAVFRAVHFDQDKIIRRNLPPRFPSGTSKSTEVGVAKSSGRNKRAPNGSPTAGASIDSLPTT